MNIITAVLRLVRFPYLITGLLIMFVTRFFIIRPILAISDLSLQFTDLNFGLLVFSLSSLMAAGYIINDYFDSKADRLARNNGTVIDKNMSRLTAITLHTVLNILAILTAAWVSDNIGMLKLSALFLLASGLLWFYSTYYKHTQFMGKVILSAMIACLPLIITIYEIPDLNKVYGSLLNETRTSFRFLFNWTGGFAIFLFIVSLIRLMIKEKIDTVGKDCKISMHIEDRIVLYLLYLILISISILLYVKIFNKDMITPWYFTILIILPALLSITQVTKTTRLKNIKLCDLLIKIITLAGIIYTFVINYILNNNLI